MVGMEIHPITKNEAVQKSIRRLRAMGLKVHILPKDSDEAYIFISLESLADLIEKQITFQNREVKIENPYLVIRVWRYKK
jgi:ABC-type lipoprotein release transport system permease subunit